MPLTEFQWSAGLNLGYVFSYGKFAGFGDFIFHYDAYVVAGVGEMSTRPIAAGSVAPVQSDRIRHS